MANPRLPLSRLTRRVVRLSQTRQYSQPPQHDPHALLSKPTWSIRALLPPSTTTTTTTTTNTTPTPTPATSPSPPPPPPQKNEPPLLTPTKLSHLLNLSALPLPPTPSATTALLTTLHAQLHFVRDIQRVNTANTPPLSAIRDETAAGQREATIGLGTAAVAAALGEEEVHGRCRRPRRRRRQGGVQGAQGVQGERKEEGGGGSGIEGVEDWDVLGGAGERVGRYFVVRSGKGVKEGE